MRTFCIVVGLLVYSVSGVAQFASDLRIVHEDARSATIEFIPIFFASVSDRGQHELETAASARFKFSGYLVDHAKPGMPIDLFRAVNILLPTRRYALHVLASEYEDVSGVQPYIAPALKGDEFGFIQTPNDAAPLAPEKMSRRDVAELIAVAPDHGEYIGTLRLYPVQYSADGYSARVYRRIVVRIDFDSRRAGVSVDPSRRKATAVIERTGAVPSASDSPLAQGEWYRLDVRETGIYKLDQNFLSRNNIPLSQVGNMNTIRIFGNDGTELPEDIAAPRPDGLEEVPRHIIDRNGNGVLESDDAVLFYGKSTSGWTYAPQQKTYNHYINHYTETNSYFLTFGGAPGKAMDSLVSTSLAGAYAPADYQGKHFVEEELFNHGQNGVSSGREWIGRQFDDATRSQTFTALLSGVDATKPALYRYVLLSRSTTTDSYSIFENDQQLGSPVLTFPIDVTSITDDKYHRTPVVTATRTGSYPNDRSVLRFTFNSSNASALGWVDWFEILYRRRFEAVSDSMLFTSPDTTANVEYRLSKFTSRDVRVFDVTDHRNVKHISNVTFDPADATVCRFQLPQTQGSAREFVAVGANGYETPVAVTKVANSNLHGVADGADFIILSPPEFLPAANRLKAHREQPGDEYLKTLVVNVESMFNEFSSGVLDPMAIRDFLRYATTQWSRKPQYVLLFGDGSYDYKDNLNRKQKENWIIPYESLNSINQIFSYSSDDHFVILEPDNPRTTIAMGRLPVQSSAEADSIVTKIINYETSAPFDTWRNRITYVADDGLTSTGDDFDLHTRQSEQLAQSHTPAAFDRRKIFIVEYPTVVSSAGRRKPEANKAILDAMNNGTLIVNYTGHGNTKVWAHEWIFTDEGELPKLANVNKPFLLVAATCDYARWDLPSDRSAGEKIVANLRGGAIAVMTSIRAVYSFENSLFNNTFFDYLLERDSLGRPPRLGDAMKLTKQLLLPTPNELSRVNHLKYHLLADPTMRLGMPRVPTSLDSIAGKPTTQIVRIPTLARTAITGTVMRADSTRWAEFDGRALIEVFDTKRRIRVPEWGSFTFERNGSLLYRGEVSVAGGIYRGEFPVPKDVSYDLGSARVSVYTWGNGTDGVGYTENVRIEGTDTTAVADTTGPQIRLYLDSDSFRPGDVVKPDATLFVELYDQSGINTSTAGIGHRLEAVLSTQQQPIDLTEYYRGNLDTYQSGAVVYPLSGLPEGKHSLTLRAWDIHNNSALVDTYFDVRLGSDASIFNVLNFPNPFSNSTMFTFQRNSFEPVDVEIKIYTLAGRLIESIETPSVADRFVQISWNGRDRDGNELANGVYFYKVITRSFDRTQSHEVLGKLTVLR